MSNIERLTTLLARLDEWNALAQADRAALLRAGGGITLEAEDFAALLDVVLGLVRRLN